MVFDRPVITLDVDWAPDWMIDSVADILIKNHVKATWFVTHESPAIRRLQSSGFFEIGLHPNFALGSTQGANPKEVMTFLTTAFSGSRIVRMHGLIQSSSLLAMLVNDFAIEIDASLLLVDTPGIVPHQIYLAKGLKPLLRIPCFWEDDIEGNKPQPCWSLEDLNLRSNGLKVCSFHPVHIILNSPDNVGYDNLKNYKRIQDLTLSDVKPHIHTGIGSGKLFNDLVRYISDACGGGGKDFRFS